ncbi:hypothetical protein [Streptomyces sp. NPDC018584]
MRRILPGPGGATTSPPSADPKAVAMTERYLTTGEPWIAEIGGVVAGTS